MHIAVSGSGYLATIISACIADFGMPVTCFDTDGARIMELAQGNIPFFEKNLKEVVKRNVRSGRLIYSTDPEAHTRRAQVIFIASDSYRLLEERCLEISAIAPPDAVLVICTPAPVGTIGKVERAVRKAGGMQSVVCHPLFLTGGCAVEDFNWPDRILLGTSSSHGVAQIKNVYRPLVMRGIPVIVTNYETAELAREASTAFVATKISFINELANLCERVNADAVDLALALGLDKRIAPRCLQAGVGFGGSFVESEMDSLALLASNNGVSLKVLSAARDVHRNYSDRIVSKIENALDTLRGKDIGLLGLAFKPHTNTVAGSSDPAGAWIDDRRRQGKRLRPGRNTRSTGGTEFLRALLRDRVRGSRGYGRTGSGNGLAGIPRARFRTRKETAAPTHHRGYQEPARFRAIAEHGL